jgi:hypothetical protein
VTDAERIAALTQQVVYWRNMAADLNQIIQASRNTPEKITGHTTLHADPTGTRAAANVDRQRRRKA